MYRCWQLGHEIVIVGLWASTAARKQRAIDAFYEALFAKKKKRRKPTHLNPVGVHKHIHTHTHTSPLLYFTHLKYSVSSCTSMHIYTPTNVHVCVYVWVSIPLLFFVLVAVYYRSQLCNCVGGVAYFLHTSLSLSLLLLFLPLSLCFSHTASLEVLPQNKVQSSLLTDNVR